MTEHNTLENAIKLYQVGKDNYIKDEKLAKQCIMLSLEKLNNLKESKQSNNFKHIIQTTEAECHKLLNSKEHFDIFKLITINDLSSIKNIELVNFREINSNGNTVIHHAIDIGDIGIMKELLKKGGYIDSVNGNGNTLLEYACIKGDPNIINFLVQHGANMAKHVLFRKGNKKYYLNKPDIDMAILLKLIVTNSFNHTSYIQFKFLEKYFNLTELIGLEKFTILDLLIGLENMFNKKESYNTYKLILIEELNNYDIHKSINNCIYNKIDIVLSNIVPFINYPFNVSSVFLIKNELKYCINNILKTHKENFKEILILNLFETYINTKLFPEDYIGIIIYNLLSKIKL